MGDMTLILGDITLGEMTFGRLESKPLWQQQPVLLRPSWQQIRCLFLHCHFIFAVHIWFISYIINTHFFHGNIWTHNWPAPIVSSFIAQLVEHRTGNREVTGSNPVEVLNFFQASLRNCINCVHCDDHFFIFTSCLQFIYDLFQISLTLFVKHWKYSLNRSRKKIS